MLKMIESATKKCKSYLYEKRNQIPRRKQRGIKLEMPQGAGQLTLAAIAKCLQAITWLVARGNKKENPEKAQKVQNGGNGAWNGY